MSKKKSDRKSIKDKNNIFFPNMKKSYFENVVPSLVSRFSYSNNLEVTQLVAISLNMGVGDAKINSKSLDSAVKELTAISGQKPIVTKSKSDISNFKIRKGFPVGCKVTLRSTKMY